MGVSGVSDENDDDDEGWPVVSDEDSVPKDSLDPLADGHSRATVQTGDWEV